MKEFVVLSASKEVIDRASLRVNLTKDGQPGTVTIEFEGDFLIGDKIENGIIDKVEAGNSERANIKKEKDKISAIKNSIKNKLGLTDEEMALLPIRV